MNLFAGRNLAYQMQQRELRQATCDHEWETVDESFDHEFGTEIVVYDMCKVCEAVTPYEGMDYD
jgi:hypothetical protein